VNVDLSGITAPSAKAARALLTGCGAFERQPGEVRKVLLVLARANDAVWKSFRNFPEVTVRSAIDLCAFDVISSRIVMAEVGALDSVAERVGSVAAEGGAQ
jgi:large subunit ribosomal protein L4